MKSRTKNIAVASAIAAIYTVLTLFPGLSMFSFGAVQFRVSEALCVLPVFTPAAVYGLTAGCFVSNILSSTGLLDMIFGTLATLLATMCTYRMRRLHTAVALIPPVVFNGVIVGWMITYFYTETAGRFTEILLLNMSTVALGEFGVCYFLGLPLANILKKHKNIFQ